MKKGEGLTIGAIILFVLFSLYYIYASHNYKTLLLLYMVAIAYIGYDYLKIKNEVIELKEKLDNILPSLENKED